MLQQGVARALDSDRATARASSSAWSNPRERRCSTDVGAQVTHETGRSTSWAIAAPEQRDGVAVVAELERDHDVPAGVAVLHERPAGLQPGRRRQVGCRWE